MTSKPRNTDTPVRALVKNRGLADKSVRLTPVRIGIIGCGNVLSAYRAAIDKLRQRGLATVTLACGRENQRETACRELGIAARSASGATFTTQVDEVLRSAEIDLVLILTSMTEHARLAQLALSAGKHVLVEKPLAMSLPEAGAVIEAARKARKHLVCAPFVTLSPTFQTMLQRIRSGDIGKPCLARARYGWAGPWWTEWFYKKGGGCLFDLGVYCVTSLTGLLGPAKRVSAMAGVAIPEREINGRKIKVEAEDNMQLSLDFGDSCFGVVTTGFTMQQYRNPAIEIYGTTGTIQMMGDDWDPDGYELWQNSAGCWQVFRETAPDWSWTDGLRDFVESLHAGREPAVKPEHAQHVLEIMLKAQQSAREGRALMIETTFEAIAVQPGHEAEAAHLMHDRSRETARSASGANCEPDERG
jgi:predicted dehydrogenase